MDNYGNEKGPTKGSGGKHRNALKGKGPTPKAEDRVYHKAYKAKKAAIAARWPIRDWRHVVA